MDKTFIRQEARCYFVPFLLGDNKKSHRLSRKILRKYSIRSFVLDDKRTFADIWNFSSKFLKLSITENDYITLLQLLDFASELPYTMPILIPCSDEYEKFVKIHQKELESVFVLSNEALLFTASPLKIIPLSNER